MNYLYYSLFKYLEKLYNYFNFIYQSNSYLISILFQKYLKYYYYLILIIFHYNFYFQTKGSWFYIGFIRIINLINYYSVIYNFIHFF
jgi:hypothetical protein